MPRHVREKSSTGIYHIMLTGINQQQIFEEKEDYDRFLEVLKDCKDISKFELYAYCLMGNHVHLLIKEKEEDISLIIKRLGSRFVYWYNIKYQRVGHLFQDRFKSEPVNDQLYFNTVLTYIHQNPVKAGICKDVSDYPYSSYDEYVIKTNLVDTSFVLSERTVEQFISLVRREMNEKCLDIEEQQIIRFTDEQAKALIKKISGCENVADFQTLDSKKRDKCLKKLRDKGISIRQICRLTGISFGIVRKFN